MKVGCYQHETDPPYLWYDAGDSKAFHEDLVAVHFNLGSWVRYATPLHSLPIMTDGGRAKVAGTYFPFCRRICVLKNCYFRADDRSNWDQGTAQWYAPRLSTGDLAPEDDRPETVHPVVDADLDIPPIVWQVFGSNALSKNHNYQDRRNWMGEYDPANWRTGGTLVSPGNYWTGGTTYTSWEDFRAGISKPIPKWRKGSAPAAADQHDPDQVAEKIYDAYNAANLPDIVDCPHDVYLMLRKYKCRVRFPAPSGARGIFDWGVKVEQAHAYFYVAGLEKA